jgi:hypothetical protein
MDVRLSARAAAGIAALLVLGGCAPAVSLPEREPDAVGTATDVMPSSPDAIRFTLTGYNEMDYFWHAVITVGPQTVLSDSEGRPMHPEAIASGNQVSIWVEMCAESYPVQCTATALRLDAEESLLP